MTDTTAPTAPTVAEVPATATPKPATRKAAPKPAAATPAKATTAKATPAKATAKAKAVPVAKPEKVVASIIPTGDEMTCVRCSRVRPVTKFPTTAKPGFRGTTCRECRDAHLPAKAPKSKATPAA